jgi:hypothetical protein
MSDPAFRPVLEGQKALVFGVANDDSIAYGCAKAFRTVGADLAISWNEAAHKAPLGELVDNHGRRRRLRLSRDSAGEARHRRYDLCRWGRKPHRLGLNRAARVERVTLPGKLRRRKRLPVSNGSAREPL